MPILIKKDIPAYKTLQAENIFVMNEERASSQDIRPIEVAILNLMPTKLETETQLLRMLSNTPLQVNVTFLQPKSHKSKNTSLAHLEKFYTTFDQVKDKRFDGMIITGAPVEQLEFEQVDYWEELKEIFDFTKTNVTSTMLICWGAQAGLYYLYGIKKYPLKEKLSGIYKHTKLKPFEPLLKGFDDSFFIPHSRYTTVKMQELKKCDKLSVLSYSKTAGASIIKSNDNKYIFVTGHFEYDADTLKKEYERDLAKGLNPKPPRNYFLNSEKTKVENKWASGANLLYSNWLNYYVYQVTPFKW